jgi:hypothetical protein
MILALSSYFPTSVNEYYTRQINELTQIPNPHITSADFPKLLATEFHSIWGLLSRSEVHVTVAIMALGLVKVDDTDVPI